MRSGRARPSARMMRHNGLALEFVATIADEKKGRTRVAAAIRALNFVRNFLGITPISDDPRTQLLQEGVLRANPHLPRGAPPFPPPAVVAIASRWGRSRVWWKRMVATFVFVDFLTLLRGAGLRAVPRRGVTWLVGQKEMTNPRVIPPHHSGALMLVTKRKTRQKAHSWAPLRRGKASLLLADHLTWMRSLQVRPRFLFPARKRSFVRGKSTWVPNARNAISSSSLLSLIRKALRDVCGLSAAQADQFTIHSLRVGGINFYRQLGVPLELRAQLADHMSLPSSIRYLRMSPAEQMNTLATITRQV